MDSFESLFKIWTINNKININKDINLIKHIKDHILEQLEANRTTGEIKAELGISDSMLSQYKAGGYKPSLLVAIRLYSKTKIVLHPFSGESLQLELEK